MGHKRELFTPAVHGLLAAFGSDVVLKLIGLAATFVTLHSLEPLQYGLWQLLLSIASMFGIVTFPGIASMFIAEISREYGAGRKQEGNDIAVRSATIFICMSALGAVAMIVAAPFIKDISGIHIVDAARIMALSVFAIGVKQAFQMALNSRLLFIPSQGMKIVDRLSYVVWICFFLLYMHKGVDGVVYAYVLASITSVVVYAPYMFRIYREMFHNRSSEDWSIIVHSMRNKGVWVVSTDAIGTASGSLWPWLVGYFLGIETLGAISVAVLMLGQVAAFIPISYVLRAILPRTVGSPERLREWLFRSMKFSLWGHIITGIGAFGASVIIFPIWFPQHVEAIPIFAALLLSLPLRGLSTSATEWFYATGNQRSLFLVSSIPKLVMLILLPAFLWGAGIVGYALWYLLSSDVVLMARLKKIRESLAGDLPLREMFSFDAVDHELMSRIWALVRGKVVAKSSY